jgi:hypothetical protein
MPPKSHAIQRESKRCGRCGETKLMSEDWIRKATAYINQYAQMRLFELKKPVKSEPKPTIHLQSLPECSVFRAY